VSRQATFARLRVSRAAMRRLRIWLPGQYTSFVFTAHLIEAGIDASIGTVGDAIDSALMESTIGLYKTELIKPRGPWRTLADVELATAEYVDWFNTRRLHTAIGGVPPAEYEAAYYAQTQPDPEAGPKN
jgi:putative transposase